MKDEKCENGRTVFLIFYSFRHRHFKINSFISMSHLVSTDVRLSKQRPKIYQSPVEIN